MERRYARFVAVGIVVVVLLAAVWSITAPARAREITPDAQWDDWVDPAYPWAMMQEDQINIGQIDRDPMWEGEYVWSDDLNDTRTDLSNPETNADLLAFRVTADRENLYFIARMQDITVTSGDGAPMLQIAIDTDQVAESGQTWFGGLAETQVLSPTANWEALVTTLFGSGSPQVRLYHPDWSTETVGEEAISASNEVIELAVPWSALGMAGPPLHPLRFTVAVCRADVHDDCKEIYGSDMLDAITNYGDPGTSLNTWDEVSDGVVDYFFDLFFQPDGDVYPPLLISEVLYDPSGPESDAEFIEIYNISPVTLTLLDYKIGDEEAIGGGEGMERLPGGSIGPGEVVVIANSADVFTSTYHFLPDYAFDAAGEPVSQTTRDTLWATGNVALGNSGDEVILLDPSYTAIDVVEYEDSSPEWKGLGDTDFGVANGESMERYPAHVDTNDIADDFIARGGDGDPGQVRDTHLMLTKLAVPDSGLVAGDEVTYTIVLSNAGTADAAHTLITDALPSGTQFARWVYSPTGTLFADGVITWTGTVSAEQAVSLTFVVTNGVRPAGEMVTNTAFYRFTDETGQDEATYTIAMPHFTLTKSVTPTMVDYHNSLTYTIALLNDGGDAASVLLTDVIPSAVTFDHWVYSPTGTIRDGSAITWTGNVSTAQPVTMAFVVQHTASNGGTVVNHAGYAWGTMSGEAEATCTVATVTLQITKTVVPTRAGYGEALTYTVDLRNDGTGTAAGVRLTDTLPLSTTFARWVEQPVGAVEDGGLITWTGTVTGGGNVRFRFVVTNTALAGTVTNTVRYAHSSGTGEAGATYTVLQPHLNLTKTVTPTALATPEDFVTYTIVLNNDGEGAASQVVLTDVLPSAVHFGGWVMQPGGAIEANDRITWTIGTLAPADTLSLIFTATLGLTPQELGAPYPVTNTAYLSALGYAPIEASAAFLTPPLYRLYLPLVMRQH